MKRRCILIFVEAAFAVALLVCNARAQDSAACKLTSIGEATVTAVRDGGTLMLADGRELKLAGIEVAGGSHETLLALAGGQKLRLETLGPDQDRYGRLVAFAFPGQSRQ